MKLFVQRESDFQRYLPVSDFAVLNIPAGFGDLEPPHIANGFPRAVQRILDRPFKPVGRRADYLNFFVNVFSHAPLSAVEMAKTIKTTALTYACRVARSVGAAHEPSIKFALQTHPNSGSLAKCESQLAFW